MIDELKPCPFCGGELDPTTVTFKLCGKCFTQFECDDDVWNTRHLSTQQVNAISEAMKRMKGLHEYLNSKELTNINRLINEIKHGKQAERELRAFLDVVPAGKWDANRKKYAALVLENTGDE